METDSKDCRNWQVLTIGVPDIERQTIKVVRIGKNH